MKAEIVFLVFRAHAPEHRAGVAAGHREQGLQLGEAGAELVDEGAVLLNSSRKVSIKSRRFLAARSDQLDCFAG